MSLLDLLIAGDVSAFNETRGERARLDLFAVELPNAALAGVDFSSANISKADLTGANLSGATLYKTDMTGIDGTELCLIAVVAHRARFREAYIDQADLSDGDFTKADFSEAVLIGSNAFSAVFTGAKLREVSAEGACFTKADLSEASLLKGDFRDASFEHAELRDAKGAEVNFSGANLEEVNADGARFQESDFSGAKMARARFTKADLTKSSFFGADLSLVDFSEANLSLVDFSGATLRGASLSDACVDGVDFSGLDLEDVDMSGLDPVALGLTQRQIDQLSRFGADVDIDAPLRYRDLSAAHLGDFTVIFWKNTDDLHRCSARFTLFTPEGEPIQGILPISAKSVLSMSASPAVDGFRLSVILTRPAGTTILVYPLSFQGVVGSVHSTLLGYDPAVLPTWSVVDDALHLWGLARQGPSLLCHRFEGEEWRLVGSDRVTTARGMLGHYSPVVACKGGVLMSGTVSGVGDPLRCPDAFTGALTAAVPSGDTLVVFWVEADDGDQRPGGLRYSTLVRRGAATSEIITVNPDVICLEAIPSPRGVHLAWVEANLDETEVFYLDFPTGEMHKMSLASGTEVEEISLSLGEKGAPRLVIRTAEETVFLCDLSGKIIGAAG